MANPMTAAELVAALKKWGVTVVEHDGWRTHNRNSKGAWGPVNGSMVHHTATSDGVGVVEVCFDGRDDLPGPLCTGVIRKSGVVYLVGNGRCNHAGNGGANVYAAVMNETAIPAPPGKDSIDGNAHFYGWECVNKGDGSDPWPEAQLDAMARVQAAICDHYGWSAQSVIGHKEWTTRKPDPRGIDMAQFRARVAALLKTGPTPTEDDMPLTDAEWKKLDTLVKTASFAGVWNTDSLVAPKDLPDIKTNPTWAPQSYLRDIDNRVRALQATEAVQSATIAKLVEVVAVLASGVAGLDPAAIVAQLTAAIESIDVHLDVNNPAA